MTRPRLDGNDSPFSDWVRRNPRLPSKMFGVSDIDGLLLFHKHHTDRVGPRDVQHLMIVEYKTHGAMPTDSQWDSLKMLSQALSRMASFGGAVRRSAKSQRVFSRMNNRLVTLKTWGAHLLVFSGTSPTDSQWMRWDNREINTYDLEQLLRFDLNPWNFKRLHDRRHHTATG